MSDTLQAILKRQLGVDSLEAVPNRYGPEGFCFSCAGVQAVGNWQRLRSLFERTRCWPVILGDDDEKDRVLEIAQSEFGQPYEQILKDSVATTPEEWLSEREAGLLDDGSGRDTDEVRRSFHGSWPDRVDALTQFTIPYGTLDRKPKQKVTMGLFAVQNSCEIPAVVNFGGWNDCPSPFAHVLMMRKWAREYGAELVGMSGDVVEMLVERPPQSRESALKLATEQFLYCSDIVTQGAENIESLAAALLGTKIWFFWWD